MSVYRRKEGGRWYIRYYHDGQEYRVAGGRTKREAQDKERRIKVELKQGADPDSFNVSRTFRFLAEVYLDDPDVKALGWYPSVKTKVGRLTESFGMLRITSVKAPAIAKFKEERLKDGVKQSTINRELAVLRRMFRWGAEQGHVHTSAIPTIKLTPEEHKIISITEEEEARLLKKCSDWLSPLVIVGVDTGCRIGEILALTWKDLDFKAGTIQVTTSKRGKDRKLYMTPRVRALLEAMPTGLPDVGVFRFPRGKYRVSTVGRTFKKAAKDAGLSSEVTFHALRHTFATRQVEKDTNAFVLKEMLGHKTLNMVLRYAHVNPSDIRRAMLDTKTS